MVSTDSKAIVDPVCSRTNFLGPIFGFSFYSPCSTGVPKSFKKVGIPRSFSAHISSDTRTGPLWSFTGLKSGDRLELRDVFVLHFRDSVLTFDTL